jgi:EAL domain-containing protein (putative c-di-GMP-specific phosphodiesterase class I)
VQAEHCEYPALELLADLEGGQVDAVYFQPIFSAETGEIVCYEERWRTDQELECNAQNSMSIKRLSFSVY